MIERQQIQEGFRRVGHVFGGIAAVICALIILALSETDLVDPLSDDSRAKLGPMIEEPLSEALKAKLGPPIGALSAPLASSGNPYAAPATQWPHIGYRPAAWNMTFWLAVLVPLAYSSGYVCSRVIGWTLSGFLRDEEDRQNENETEMRQDGFLRGNAGNTGRSVAGASLAKREIGAFLNYAAWLVAWISVRNLKPELLITNQYSINSPPPMPFQVYIAFNLPIPFEYWASRALMGVGVFFAFRLIFRIAFAFAADVAIPWVGMGRPNT